MKQTTSVLLDREHLLHPVMTACVAYLTGVNIISCNTYCKHSTASVILPPCPPPLSQLSYRSQSQLPFLSYTYWKQTHICQLLGLRHNQLWQRCVCVCMCVHVGVGELAGKFTLAVCTCWSVQQLCTITPLYNITGDSNIKV